MNKQKRPKMRCMTLIILVSWLISIFSCPYIISAESGGHVWSEWIIDREPTCTNTGHRYRVCLKFPDKPHTEEEILPLIDHDYQVSGETAATCTTYGTITYTCQMCQDSYSVEAESPLGHNYGDWIVVKEPTVDEEGLQVRICANDPTHEITETLPVVEAPPPPVEDAVVEENEPIATTPIPTETPAIVLTATPEAELTYEEIPVRPRSGFNALDVILATALTASIATSGSIFLWNYSPIRREYRLRREYLRKLHGKGGMR